MDITERQLLRLKKSLLGKPNLYVPGDVELLLAWLRAARKTKPVLFAGAGVSLAAKAPGGGTPKKLPALWWQLECRMRDELGFLAPAKSCSPMWLAQVYENAFGRHRMLELLREEIPDERLEPGKLHHVLARIGWEAVVTTNYDSLLDRVFEPASRSVVTRDAQLASSRASGSLEVLHPHGSFVDQDDLVFTLESYRCFPTKRPGMLAKIRQLVLQHPVLFVGFGAEDPNFIEWAGWVRDVAHDSQPLWLSLDVSGTRRGEYVARIYPGIRFFHIEQKDATTRLEKVVGAVADALRSQETEWEAVLTADIEEATSVEEVMQALELARHASARDPRLRSMKNILDSSLRSTIRLSEIAEWKALIERVERFPARRDEAQEKEDLKNVRTAFGGHWIRYCEHLLEFQGLRPRLGRIEVNLVEETSMRDQKTVRLAVLAGKVATASLDELKQLAGEFAGPANDAERRYFSNWRMAMLSAGSVPPPDANPSSAHEYRYLGFTFALRDQRSLAHEAYEKAVWASKAEGEPLWLQHLTTSSAMVFNSEFERQIFGIGEPVDPRLREHQRAVALSDEVSVWSRRVNQALTATINSLREHEVSNTRVMGSPNIPALPLQQRMEQEWIAPAVIAPLAAAAGQLMLYGPEARKGVGLLAFYGDDKALPQYVRRLVRLQSTSGVEPGIIDELLSDSASFLEHAAKATALEQAVSELRDVEMVVAHVVSVLTSNKPSNHVGLSWRSDPYVEHRQLLESILKVHGPPQQAKATLALLEPSERSRTGVYLPWESWLIRGQIDGETAGDWWRLAHTRFRERCIEVALRAHQCGRDSGFFRELLDEVSAEPPTLDDAAFNRARAVLALSGADAQLSHLNSLAALVKSSSNSVPTGVLLALAERAETIDKQILKQVIIRRLENLESLGAHFWVGRNVREIEELLRVLAKVHKVGRSVELQRILFRWFEREPFFWAALREAQAFLRERTFRETTLRYLADAEVEKNNHQRMGLLGVSRFQSQDKSDLWWLSDALALTNATSPDVVADSLHVLSNDDAREALEGAGLVELVLATFHRVNRDGRAIVRAALVTAASHWAKKHERFGAMIESSSGDERALVRAALLEHEDRHVSPQIEDDQ